MRADGDPRIVQHLVDEGVLTAEQADAALRQSQRDGARVEEVLLELGLVDEPVLLQALAALYRTRFVSTDKLRKADIDPRTLEKVPAALAQRETLFPVLWDPEAGVLSVVMPDPDNHRALQEVQRASGAQKVRAFVGRPRAVRAAIGRAYGGDIHAFAVLDRDAHREFATMLDLYDRQLVSEESMTVALAWESERQPIRVLSPEELESEDAGRGPWAAAGWDTYLATLNVLVGLLEQARPDLRGHSAQVARLMRTISERMALPESQQLAAALAGYVHDLGKMGSQHLTALNVAEDPAHRAAADKLYRAPARLLEAVALPKGVWDAVDAMYERFDGQGLPGRVRGKDIPLGARLLAIADTYADLTQNPRNLLGRSLTPQQACEALGRYRGTVFDPNLVDLFQHAVTGEHLKARLLAERYKALIVDPDPEEAMVLELRMTEQGFDVQQARGVEQASRLLERGELDLVISELDLPDGDGLALLAEVRRHKWGQRLPWMFVTGRAGRVEAERAFELGVADFVTKPTNTDLLVAKAKQFLEREAASHGRRGVSGSLREMSLPDVVQVLWHGRKTGSLSVRSDQGSGEIHFVDGMIYNALWANLRGAEAVYAMLRLADGEFSLDPNARAPQRLIPESPETLLLEAMRRLDEA